jgi:UDPglucose 6-dehydrogenase
MTVSTSIINIGAAELDHLNTRSEIEIHRFVKVINKPYQAMNDAHAVASLTEWDKLKLTTGRRYMRAWKSPRFCFVVGVLWKCIG